MRNFVKSLEIDLEKEIKNREEELKKIGKDVDKKSSMNIEDCYDRVYELSELVADNLEIKLDDNFKDELHKRIKIYESSNIKDFIKNPTKLDIILPIAYTCFTIPAIVHLCVNNWLWGYYVIAGNSIMFITTECAFKIFPNTNLVTNEITLLRYFREWRDDYVFDDMTSHELTHYFSFKNKKGFKNKLRLNLFIRKNTRREEGIAITSEMLTLEKLFNQTNDINYKRQKLLRENKYLSDAKKFEKKLNCYLTRIYPLNELTHRNHGEGFAKMLELTDKYGDSTLPRVFRGEFDKEFK